MSSLNLAGLDWYIFSIALNPILFFTAFKSALLIMTATGIFIILFEERLLNLENCCINSIITSSAFASLSAKLLSGIICPFFSLSFRTAFIVVGSIIIKTPSVYPKFSGFCSYTPLISTSSGTSYTTRVSLNPSSYLCTMLYVTIEVLDDSDVFPVMNIFSSASNSSFGNGSILTLSAFPVMRYKC